MFSSEGLVRRVYQEFQVGLGHFFFLDLSGDHVVPISEDAEDELDVEGLVSQVSVIERRKQVEVLVRAVLRHYSVALDFLSVVEKAIEMEELEEVLGEGDVFDAILVLLFVVEEEAVNQVEEQEGADSSLVGLVQESLFEEDFEDDGQELQFWVVDQPSFDQVQNLNAILLVDADVQLERTGSVCAFDDGHGGRANPRDVAVDFALFEKSVDFSHDILLIHALLSHDHDVQIRGRENQSRNRRPEFQDFEIFLLEMVLDEFFEVREGQFPLLCLYLVRPHVLVELVYLVVQLGYFANYSLGLEVEPRKAVLHINQFGLYRNFLKDDIFVVSLRLSFRFLVCLFIKFSIGQFSMLLVDLSIR